MTKNTSHGATSTAPLLKQKKLSKTDRARKLELSKQMSARRQEIGLSKWALQSYIKVYGKRYSRLISSQ